MPCCWEICLLISTKNFFWPKDSLVPGLNQHQGVFWPDHLNTKESLGQITPQNIKGHFPEFTFTCTKEPNHCSLDKWQYLFG